MRDRQREEATVPGTPSPMALAEPAWQAKAVVSHRHPPCRNPGQSEAGSRGKRTSPRKTPPLRKVVKKHRGDPCRSGRARGKAPLRRGTSRPGSSRRRFLENRLPPYPPCGKPGERCPKRDRRQPERCLPPATSGCAPLRHRRRGPLPPPGFRRRSVFIPNSFLHSSKTREGAPSTSLRLYNRRRGKGLFLLHRPRSGPTKPRRPSGKTEESVQKDQRSLGLSPPRSVPNQWRMT